MISKIWLILISFCCIELSGYNRFNHLNYKTTEIQARWLHKGKTHSLKNSHIRYEPIFGFSLDRYKRFMIDNQEYLTFRNNSQKKVSTKTLTRLMNQLIQQLTSTNPKKIRCRSFHREAYRQQFENFVVIQDKNFNFSQSCGCIILAFKDYPFILKLFMETPETFTNPYCKGIEPICFHYMGWGAGRHTTGFTRLTNLEYINKKITSLPEWNGKVSTPRKWLWVPKPIEWMEIIGKNIDGKKQCSTKIPSVYAIIADHMTTPSLCLLSNNSKASMIMQLCNDLELAVDPHQKNFLFYTDAKNQQTKIIIIDTEHFPTMVGLRKKKTFASHQEWYLYLTWKCFKDTFLCTKEQRSHEPLRISDSTDLHRAANSASSSA